MKVVAGIDIGGTKCAVSFARCQESGIEILEKVRMKTEKEFQRSMREFIRIIQDTLDEHPEWELVSIGLSCGGPLDSRRGLVLSPPNLPDWDGVDCFTPLRRVFGVPVALQNDADACALAEWRWGAGRGCSDMVATARRDPLKAFARAAALRAWEGRRRRKPSVKEIRRCSARPWRI